MLSADNLCLFKDDKKIFNNLAFSISINSVLIIKGENGCGKTSLLKILSGTSLPSSGKVLWGDEDILEIKSDFMGDSQFLGHKNFFKNQLTIRQNLEFYAKINDSLEAVDSALRFFELDEIADQKVSKLSAGTKQRALLSILLACPATIWFLDEPSNNLDKKWQEKLYELIKTRAREDGLIIMATHDEMFFDLGPKIEIGDFK